MSDLPFAGTSLCVVGNINRDIKTAPLPSDAKLFQDGETSVASITETVGGGGANSACAARSLGGQVVFLGKVGADALGDRLERALRRQGISTHLSRDPAHASGSSIALSYQNRQRHFVSCLSASEALCFEDLDLGALGGCQHLLRADVWFSEAMLFEGNQRLFRKAKELGLAISVDLNWDPQWRRAGNERIRMRKQAVRDVLPWVDLAHGNARELMEFTEATDLESALARLIEWGVGAVVVHLGPNGAGYYEQGSFITEAAAPVRAPVNVTGTGDVLSVCVMLLHGRTEMAIQDRLRLANRIVAEFMEGKRLLIPALAD